MQRWLISPEIGALIGAIIVWAFFWGNGQTFGEADTTLNWLDVAAPTGIMAAAVALVDDRRRVRPVGWRHDRRNSDPDRIGLALLHGQRRQHRLGNRLAFLAAAAIGWFNGYHGQQDRVAELHRHPGDVLHAPRRDAGDRPNVSSARSRSTRSPSRTAPTSSRTGSPTSGSSPSSASATSSSSGSSSPAAAAFIYGLLEQSFIRRAAIGVGGLLVGGRRLRRQRHRIRRPAEDRRRCRATSCMA